MQPTTAAVTVAPVVAVRGARHTFGQRRVLGGVNLEIPAGTVYGLLGPNGAGKTTLMRAICGRFKLNEGSVALDGDDPRTSAIARRKIGFVPQDIALYSFLTVRENLQAFARLAGVPRGEIAAAVASGLQRTGLSERADQLCRTLSGGFQRRVNICAAILHAPTLLVLDEPTVGIDIEAREAIHTLLHDLRNQGTAILLTTHDLDQAQALSDRVGILIGGRFVSEGPPKELLGHVFGDRMEVIVELASAPEGASRDALESLGLAPSQAAHSWNGYFRRDQLDMQAIAQLLADAGVAVNEMRMRQPGLTSLLVALIQADSTTSKPS